MSFDELDDDEQHFAIHQAFNRLMEGLLEGWHRFEDEETQEVVDAAREKAAKRNIPWEAHTFIVNALPDRLWGQAMLDAMKAYYHHPEIGRTK